ncbi:hypothetical protein IMG5_132630 [Ichthyophthirius multifiliis]|uniref:Enoyl-CoA hydratase domain-containing protein 3, mitochondrial n=1 Tax=Ichthyophthirius multifiliis TaxID=5932 RepID=G0QWI7_ICHMU|nr:hypothetical protein IMG5_132630 [Ichthyophthirius multifiliis]EGR30416.1 hypothetical protein IMG5_132630 [Ichthyophthirius multifiliis]|eukprot:XP_004032003.1 hypothetical protein IMG5_132630 [Ichthyophthirius multifiliis]
MFQNAGKMMHFMQQMPQINIAQVHNFATAAGCQLVSSCDQVVASKSAKFSTPGIKIGLFCSTPGVALARSMSHQKKAFEMLVTGEPINAQEAYECGLVNKLVEKEADLDNQTLQLAEQIAVHSGEVLALGKKAFYQQKNIGDLEKAYDFCSGIMSQNLQKEDCVEGLTAFMEKRHANFKK